MQLFDDKLLAGDPAELEHAVTSIFANGLTALYDGGENAATTI